MDGSDIKGMKLNGSDHVAKAKPKRREIGRVLVRGYDTKLPRNDVESALTKHFGSCGEITDIYIGVWDKILDSDGFIHFLGEGAVDKALKLSGSDMGGWNVVVEPYPFRKTPGREFGRIVATGYDTNLLHDDVESALRKHFGSCGEITDIYIGVWDNVLDSNAFIYFRGEGAVDKALELSGCDLGGWNVVAEPLPFLETQARKADIFVTGHDTSLSDADIESALRKHFSSCGQIREVKIFDEPERVANLSIHGEDAQDKVLELDGSLMGGHKLDIDFLTRLAKYGVHRRIVYGRRCGGCNPPGKKAKMTAE